MARITNSACRLTAVLLAIMASASSVMAQDTVLIEGTDRHNVTRELAVDRYPALYTGDFADCLGGESLFNITKFDAGYYADNMTVVFHLDGATNVRSEDIVCEFGYTIRYFFLVAATLLTIKFLQCTFPSPLVSYLLPTYLTSSTPKHARPLATAH